MIRRLLRALLFSSGSNLAKPFTAAATAASADALAKGTFRALKTRIIFEASASSETDLWKRDRRSCPLASLTDSSCFRSPLGVRSFMHFAHLAAEPVRGLEASSSLPDGASQVTVGDGQALARLDVSHTLELQGWALSLSREAEQELACRSTVVVGEGALCKQCRTHRLEAGVFNHSRHVALHLHEDPNHQLFAHLSRSIQSFNDSQGSRTLGSGS